MSTSQATPDTHVWQRTDTPGVYRRSGYFMVQTRPDGQRKKMHRFASYEEAVAFKAATPNRRSRKRNSLAVDYLRNDPCSYCGGLAGALDHIMPRAAGGDDYWMNLTAACRLCNGRKQDKPLLIFLAHEHGCWQWVERT